MSSTKSSPMAPNLPHQNLSTFDLPPLQGRTLDQHFYKLGVDCAEPYLTTAKQFARANPPPKPRKWVRQSGWTKYYPDGRAEKVDAPDESMLCFDTEVMWKESPFAVIACASSPTAWYAWLSPWLLGETENDRQLIPLGDPTKDRIIVGHNVGFDRARILEEYSVKQTRNCFLDTMSLHAAVNGMCSQQRPTWMKHKKNRELRERTASETPDHELAALLSNQSMHDEEELWVERSSVNSLRDVAKFHLNISIDKAIRDDFGELDRDGILAKLDELMDYCAADVSITHRIYQIVFPNFLQVCPHPVSFAALRHLSSVILPVNKSWDSYIANAEATYQKLSDAVQERLIGLTDKALEIKNDADTWQNDAWMQQLDWSGQEIKMVKGKRKNDPPRPAARQKKPGMPKWYKDLFQNNDAPINITVRTRIAPLLLKLAWDGHPLFWSDKYGWTFRVPREETAKYTGKQMIQCVFDEAEATLRDDRTHAYFKLPHKDGPTARCVNPMAKGYLSYFENGTLSSEYSYAKEALEMNASCSYWISARDRIKSQMVVYEEDIPGSKRRKSKANSDGFILPQIIPMGTITRRAVENTWLTASNAKKNRVGSELKAMVKAPKGYCFVGADVDSEELWIASLVGDATFKLHGGNAVGFMTLEGTKAAGTDLHSRTASILGITRNDAKVFNYGRIYGAGLKFAATLLRQFNPNLSEKQTMETASKLYANTKGTKTNRKVLYKRPFWRGGTESFVFNKLEEFAEQERPRTPVLGAGITEALMGRYISKGGYLTSRINWAIQSSGVDYLHLLIVAMDYLIRRFNLDARLAITVHDEIRYLVKEGDKYRTALALQVANVWTCRFAGGSAAGSFVGWDEPSPPITTKESSLNEEQKARLLCCLVLAAYLRRGVPWLAFVGIILARYLELRSGCLINREDTDWIVVPADAPGLGCGKHVDRLRHAPICFAWNSREVASANGQAADQSMGLHADVDVVSHSCALDNHTLASERLQDPVTESKPRQAIESWNAQFGLWHIQLHVLGTVERQGQSSMQSYTKIGYVPQQLDDELAGLTVGQKTTQAMTTQHPPLTPSVNISRLPAASERA
ncbi:hypothetical protein NM208_g11452 [Fusarium decemcellulare]|uniref:Uncharacterized protein n=1 Tax=Fusarium decemcellulare TaxID=57161 RepID=A0ACC1RTK9_9HYPO|nr:hypothetical protein NM208_g11452 [Fusarium decemcellulare]